MNWKSVVDYKSWRIFLPHHAWEITPTQRGERGGSLAETDKNIWVEKSERKSAIIYHIRHIVLVLTYRLGTFLKSEYKPPYGY